MTTQFISRFVALLASAVLMSSSFAQVSEFKNLHRLLGNGIPLKVYQNILDEFDKQFIGAENVSWEKVQDNYLAKFSLGDIKKRVLLNPKGKLVYEITYGTEKHLPAHLRKYFKRRYVESTITSVIFVEEAGRSICVVNMEDDSRYIIVRVENDEIEEVGNYNKARS